MTEFLSSIATDSDCLVITGDFNFHTDDLNYKGAKVIFAILDTFELSQHVKVLLIVRGTPWTWLSQQGSHTSRVSVFLIFLWSILPCLTTFMFSFIYPLFLTYRSNQIVSKNGISMNILVHPAPEPSRERQPLVAMRPVSGTVFQDLSHHPHF